MGQSQSSNNDQSQGGFKETIKLIENFPRNLNSFEQSERNTTENNDGLTTENVVQGHENEQSGGGNRRLVRHQSSRTRYNQANFSQYNIKNNKQNGGGMKTNYCPHCKHCNRNQRVGFQSGGGEATEFSEYVNDYDIQRHQPENLQPNPETPETQVNLYKDVNPDEYYTQSYNQENNNEQQTGEENVEQQTGGDGEEDSYNIGSYTEDNNDDNNDDDNDDDNNNGDSSMYRLDDISSDGLSQLDSTPVGGGAETVNETSYTQSSSMNGGGPIDTRNYYSSESSKNVGFSSPSHRDIKNRNLIN
jgi:hypothetical protein